ncbi:hypothetical protein HDU76_002065 [Blyttiomyces sp. JEL0837]|nr:hypothetical protein HDU76_002065 [Blyttiomyces sp. JEL0837]
MTATDFKDDVLAKYGDLRAYIGNELWLQNTAANRTDSFPPERLSSIKTLARMPTEALLHLVDDAIDEINHRQQQSTTTATTSPTYDTARAEGRSRLATVNDSSLKNLACDLVIELERHWPELKVSLDDPTVEERDKALGGLVKAGENEDEAAASVATGVVPVSAGDGSGYVANHVLG